MSLPTGIPGVKAENDRLLVSLASAIGISLGGTGLTTIPAGSVLAANALDTLVAVTSTSGTKALVNTAGTITWELTSSIGATTFLALTDTPSTYASQASKLVRVNTGETALEFVTHDTTGDPHTQYGLKSGTLAQFAATTSAELFGVVSDETGGAGVLVGNASPTFTTLIETPKIIGGTAAGSALTLQSTSGVGSGDYIDFLAGNNGATRVARALGTGIFIINGDTSRGVGGRLQIQGQSTVGGEVSLELITANSDADRDGIVFFQRARGTLASPSQVSTSDRIGEFRFDAYNTTDGDYNEIAAIVTRATGPFTTRPGGSFRFNTTIIDGGSGGTRLYIDSTGIGMGGVTTPLGQLHVDQSSTTGAIPVLLLDQADIDQPLFEAVADIAVGSTIEAVGAKVLTTTHFVMIKIPGGLTRYFPIGTIA